MSRFLKLASKASLYSTHPRFQIGAVLTVGNKIVSIGYNQNKTHPLQQQYNKYRGFNCSNTIHAEIDCIIAARYVNLTGAIMYIWRYDKSGNATMCKPCKACMNAITDFGIKAVYYTNYQGAIECLKL